MMLWKQCVGAAKQTHLVLSEKTCQSLYCEYVPGKRKSSGQTPQWPETQQRVQVLEKNM